MKFFVTYGAMDHTIANPFWHAFIMLSYWPGEGAKIQVTNAWGFYAAPTTTPDSIWRSLKRKAGLDIDLQGNHGLLKIEELRYLDLGYGLRGLTFEISFEQFCTIKALCKKILANQESAIKEMTERLSKGDSVPNSKEIYEEEKRCAERERRPIRLKPFEFKLCLDANGLSLNNSYSCKSMAIDILRQVDIEDKYLSMLTEQGGSTAIPRNSGYLESIYLHSCGPVRQHVSQRTNKFTVFRTWDDKTVKLYWSLPPQLVINASSAVDFLFSYSNQIEEKIKKLVKQIHAIERLALNLKIPNESGEKARLHFIRQLGILYDKFAVICDASERQLIEKIRVVESFFEDIYFAITDEWDDEEEVVSVVALFPRDKQEELCSILNRSFMQWSGPREPVERAYAPPHF